jgi:hypothetical protein
MSKQYKLVTDDYPEGLSDKVTELLAEGWELWGNPAIYSQPAHGLLCYAYCQAMVRFEEDTVDEMLEREAEHILTDKSVAGYNVGTPSMVEFATPKKDCTKIAERVSAADVEEYIRMLPWNEKTPDEAKNLGSRQYSRLL